MSELNVLLWVGTLYEMSVDYRLPVSDATAFPPACPCFKTRLCGNNYHFSDSIAIERLLVIFRQIIIRKMCSDF